MIIKVCGMREAENIRAVEYTGIQWMGFIFYPPSPRYVSERPDYMPESVQRIGVFVNDSVENIIRTFSISVYMPYSYTEKNPPNSAKNCLTHSM